MRALEEIGRHVEKQPDEFTANELAKECGKSESVVRRWLAGKEKSGEATRRLGTHNHCKAILYRWAKK